MINSKIIIHKKLILKLLLIFYIILLLIFVILKLNSPVIFITKERILSDRLLGYWNYNLTPFKTIKDMFKDHNYINILGNIIPFLPLGFLISITTKKNNIIVLVLKCFLIIFFFEILQFITCFGFFDIDDIFLNLFACLLGITIYYTFIHIYNSKNLIKREGML